MSWHFCRLLGNRPKTSNFLAKDRENFQNFLRPEHFYLYVWPKYRFILPKSAKNFSSSKYWIFREKHEKFCKIFSYRRRRQLHLKIWNLEGKSRKFFKLFYDLNCKQIGFEKIEKNRPKKTKKKLAKISISPKSNCFLGILCVSWPST